MEPDRAVRVLEQVASALAFAHRQDIGHGDVTASHVLFDGERNAYLGGFSVGVGPPADRTSDVRQLARLARRLLGDGMPASLAGLVERAELGTEVTRADALAEAAREALERTGVAAPPRVDERNPYKGLRPFTEADARDFFGRGELTGRLVARLLDSAPGSRFLAVVGPSGSGKSSVVRAGLVPAVRRGALGSPERRFVAEMSPGAHPFDELAAALLRVAVRPHGHLPEIIGAGSRGLLHAVDLLIPTDAELLLVVDQFEEVFTLCDDERERERFLETLRVSTVDPESRVRVVATLRADFYDRPLGHPRFAELLASRTEAVPPLSPDELEQAIRQPAERVGVRSEPGLVAEMIAEVAHQPGALPLLQYALTELFERRDDDVLTLETHREIGGVAGALTARAGHILETTPPDGRPAIKQVFLRLVTLGEGSQDTRRRVLRSELDALELEPEAIDHVLDAFGRHRFLTFDRDPATREPTVEIAHEALLTAWGRLRGWIEDAREDLRQERGLARAAAEWQAAERDPSFLLRGARLEQVAAWDAATDLAIGHDERAYLKASIDQRDRDRAEQDERLRREARTERRSRTRLRALVAVFAAAALVAGVLTFVAVDQRERADREARTATARELASAAVANLEVDATLSVLLAIEAVDETRSVDGTVLPEAEAALHRAVTASREVSSIPGLGVPFDWSSTGDFVAEGAEGTGIVDVRDAVTGERVRSWKGHDGDLGDVEFSRDGTALATAGPDDGMLKVWNPTTGEPLGSLRGHGETAGPSLSRDGSIAAAAWIRAAPGRDDQVQVLDLATGRRVWAHRFRGLQDTALSPDGTQMAVTTESRTGVVFRLSTGTSFRLKGPRGSTSDRSAVSWSPDGRSIATTSVDGVPRVWDARTGALRIALLGRSAVAETIAWSPDSHRLVAGGNGGTATVWERTGVAEARVVVSIPDLGGGDLGVAFSPEGTQVMTGGQRALTIWDVGPNGDAEWMNLPSAYPDRVTFLPDGDRVAAKNRRGGLTVWDAETGDDLRSFSPSEAHAAMWSFDVSPEGDAVAAAFAGSPRGRGGRLRLELWESGSAESRWARRRSWGLTDVAFSPDGSHVVTARWDGKATVWDLSGREVRTLPERYGIARAGFGPDGHQVVTMTWTEAAVPGANRIKIWDWQEGTVLHTVTTRPGGALGFDPTGSRIVALDGLSRVQVVDVTSGKRLALLTERPDEGITALAFSADGTLVAIGERDGSMRLVDAGTGKEQLALPGNGCPVLDMAFSPDGTKLASAGCDVVKIWALDVDDLLRIAQREVAARQLTDEECRQYLHESPCPGS